MSKRFRAGMVGAGNICEFHVAAGTVVNLKRARHDLVIGGTKTRFDLAGPCSIKATPEPGCY